MNVFDLSGLSLLILNLVCSEKPLVNINIPMEAKKEKEQEATQRQFTEENRNKLIQAAIAASCACVDTCTWNFLVPRHYALRF